MRTYYLPHHQIEQQSSIVGQHAGYGALLFWFTVSHPETNLLSQPGFLIDPNKVVGFITSYLGLLQDRITGVLV